MLYTHRKNTIMRTCVEDDGEAAHACQCDGKTDSVHGGNNKVVCSYKYNYEAGSAHNGNTKAVHVHDKVANTNTGGCIDEAGKGVRIRFDNSMELVGGDSSARLTLMCPMRDEKLDKSCRRILERDACAAF